MAPLEPELYADSHWMSIKVIEVPALRASSRTRNLAEVTSGTERINFWDLVFPDEAEPEINCAFDMNETSRLADALHLFFSKKTDIVLEFLNRVDENLAPDYR